MNPDDAFDRILGLLHLATRDDAHWPAASALIEEACGAVGSGLVVGERSGGDDRIHFARFLYRGESRQDLAREYFDVHYPHDAGMRRLMGRPEGRLAHLPDLFTEDELKTSPVYNEGWRSLRAQNGLYVHFDDVDGHARIPRAHVRCRPARATRGAGAHQARAPMGRDLGAGVGLGLLARLGLVEQPELPVGELLHRGTAGRPVERHTSHRLRLWSQTEERK